jgi:WD40 repeat protein
LSEYRSVFTGTTGKQNSGSSCCIALDDDSIVTGWRDGFIRAFDRTSQSIIWEVANAHRGAITSLYVDANYILSGGQDGAVRVWARANRKLLIQFNGKYFIFKFNDFCCSRSKERYREFIPRCEQATFDSFLLNGQNHFHL